MSYTITAHIPNKHDGTSWYRASAPLSALRKARTNDWLIQTAGEFSASTAMLTDVAFFQRPSTPNELEAMRIFKRLGVPVIIDYDDLLFDVPADNPAHKNYMNKATQETVVSCVREADAVMVSTKELKRCLQLPKASLNERVYVVPNALDDIHLVRGERAAPPRRRNPTVLWRGSPTHQRDLYEYGQEILRAAQANTSTPFTFAGWNPWVITERMAPQQAVVAESLPIGEFMDFIYATAPEIGMVPLHRSRFNLCKSNIAWLEMSWAGAVCLVPEWEEWCVPGAVTYRDGEDFLKGLLTLIHMPSEQRAELNRLSWNWIKEHRRLSHVNRLREEIFTAAITGAWPEGGGPIPEFYTSGGEQVVMELE